MIWIVTDLSYLNLNQLVAETNIKLSKLLTKNLILKLSIMLQILFLQLNMVQIIVEIVNNFKFMVML